MAQRQAQPGTSVKFASVMRIAGASAAANSRDSPMIFAQRQAAGQACGQALPGLHPMTWQSSPSQAISIEHDCPFGP